MRVVAQDFPTYPLERTLQLVLQPRFTAKLESNYCAQNICGGGRNKLHRSPARYFAQSERLLECSEDSLTQEDLTMRICTYSLLLI